MGLHHHKDLSSPLAQLEDPDAVLVHNEREDSTFNFQLHVRFYVGFLRAAANYQCYVTYNITNASCFAHFIPMRERAGIACRVAIYS
jgi:hypothetical protein